jgi:hypothetical protein
MPQNRYFKSPGTTGLAVLFYLGGNNTSIEKCNAQLVKITILSIPLHLLLHCISHSILL